MTVEPKRQKRPYSYYEKTINEYSYRSMERVSKTCPEKVEALLLRFPFDDSQDKQLRRALRRCRIYPGQGCYDDCYSAGMQAYLYSIHRCALMGYTKCDRIHCQDAENLFDLRNRCLSRYGISV